MKPLYVLLGVFLLTLIAMKLIGGYMDYNLAGITAMSFMLVFTSTGHFAFTKGMMMMMPPAIPAIYRKLIVWGSGAFEFLAAIFIFVPQFQYTTSLLVIVFFVAVLPANIYAAREEIDIQRANNTGPGLRYLWLRLPLQMFFIAWIWYFGVYPHSA